MTPKSFKGFKVGLILLLLGGLPVAADQEAPQALDLTLHQAIQMALQNNLDIVVARLASQAQQESIYAARGAYRPSVSMSFNNLKTQQPATNQLTGAPTVTNTNTVYNFAWNQQFPTGGNYTVRFENLRASTNSAFFTFNPRFNSALSASVSQPLLKNWSLNPTRQQIVVAQNGEKLSRHQFEARVVEVVRDVENAYWDVVFSIRDLEVAQKSLQLAKDLLNNNRIQVEVGTMAPIDVLEAEAEVARRDEAVIIAQAAIKRNEDALKRLINNPDAPDFWGATIRPIDQPILSEVTTDVEGSVRTALSRRPELNQSRVEMDTRNFNVRYTRNQMLPQVDLIGSVAFNGLGGTQILRQGFAGPILEIIPGGYSDALSQVFGADFRDWAVGLNVSYPLGNSTADAANARAQVEFRQQRAAVTSLELQIAQDVREASRAVETNRQRIEVTRVGRELAARRLDAEQKKFAVGMSTNFFVVQAQRDLAVAEANELRAVIDYNKALVNYERARGTLLDSAQVSVK